MITNDVREHNRISDELEALIDKHSLSGVLDLLAEIASGKADHLESNWRDENGSKVWNSVSITLQVAANKIKTRHNI